MCISPSFFFFFPHLGNICHYFTENLVFMVRGSLFRSLHKNKQALDIRRRLRMALDVVCSLCPSILRMCICFGCVCTHAGALCLQFTCVRLILDLEGKTQINPFIYCRLEE